MKMAHVTIQSAKYEESVRFYQEVAGLKIQAQFDNPAMRITFLANGEGETAVEIIDRPQEAFQGCGIMVGFVSEDVNAYHDELAAKGYKVTPMIVPAPGTEFFFVEDPNGLQVQFIGE